MMVLEVLQSNCPGECRPIALSDGSGFGLKCDLCNYIHKGVGGLGACRRMVAVLFAITTGVSYRNLKAIGIIKVSTGT